MLSRRFHSLLSAAALLLFGHNSSAQLSKGHQILIDRGFQIMGLIEPNNFFHFDTYTNAGYTTLAFSSDSSGNLGPISTFTGEPPGFPWVRRAPDENNMPGQGTGYLATDPPTPYSRTNEIPHLSQLVGVQLQDEWDLNNDTVRSRLVNWFNAERTNWPNTILYHNNWGYQLTDVALVDYINRAHPDMLSFDTYPWQSVYDTNQVDSIGPAIPGHGSYLLKQWYSHLRQYREYARAYGIPTAIWRQTFHSVEPWASRVFRDPSPSELRLNTFGAIAFGVTYFSDFVYSSGASALFTNSINGNYVGYAGDSTTNSNGLYAEMKDINHQVLNWGNTLVRLTPITKEGIPGYTTSIMFLRGKDAAGNLTPIPDGFVGDSDGGGASATYTDWVYQRNDPYLRGWAVTNTPAIKNNGNPGDVIISWFKPLDEAFDGPDYTNETYMMVVNGLTDLTGTAADCAQEITLNFDAPLTAIQMLNPQTGLVELQPLTLTNGVRQLVLNLNGGEASLFKFADGAPFIPVTGAPFIGAPPVSLQNLRGTTATFTVKVEGTPPFTYQWQLNGTNISDATTSTYTRSNVQYTDAGSYTVVVSNSFGTVTSTPAVLTVVSAQPFFYEPFNYSNVGASVSVNTPANWAFGGGGANDFNVATGSLFYPGLATSGNSATNGGAGLGVRRLFGTNISSGKIYFSTLFKITDSGYGSWTPANMPAQIASLMTTNSTTLRFQILVTSNTPSTFRIGLQKGGTGATAVMDTTPRNIGDTVLLVGKYDFTVTPNPVTLWINPSPSSFGSSSEPTGGTVLTTSTGIDFNGTNVIDRFNFRQNTAPSVPAGMQWDELRLGNSWIDVTPLAPPVPIPLTNLTRLGDGNFQFSYSSSNSLSGSVYASTNLTNWVFIGSPSQVSSNLFQFTDSAGTNYPHRFYQLRWP